MLDYITSNNSLLNIIAVTWFLLVWVGYASFAKYMAKRGHNLSSLLNRQRLSWMDKVLGRDNRVTDAVLVANLERNSSFLASTSIFILAGLLTSLSVSDSIEALLQSLPFYLIQQDSDNWIHIKLLLLILIYVYCFFTLTWSMQQYGFGSVMIGSAPEPEEADANLFLKQRYAYASSKVIDMAAHTANFGLRAYLFSLAVLPWFFSPLYFIVATTLVVFVLYRREFHSRPYRVLRDYLTQYDEELKRQEAELKIAKCETTEKEVTPS